MRKYKRFLLLNALVWCLIGAMHFALLGTAPLLSVRSAWSAAMKAATTFIRSSIPIRGGIRKVNIATASFMNTVAFARDYLTSSDRFEAAQGAPNYFGMSEAMVEGTCENVKHHIKVFTFQE